MLLGAGFGVLPHHGLAVTVTGWSPERHRTGEILGELPW